MSDPAPPAQGTPGPPQQVAEEPEWRQLHPFSIVTTGIRYLRGLVLPVGILIISRGFSGGRVDAFFTFGLPLIIGLGAILLSTTHWLLYHYAVTNRELIIRSGIISRHERTVPLERIQSIDIEEAPLERLLGLARVRVETAATGSSEAKIEMHSLGQADAQALRQRLIAARQRARPTGPSSSGAHDISPATASEPVALIPEKGELIRALSVRQLLLAGATSGRIGPAAALVAVAFRFGTEFVPQSWWDRVPWQGAAHAGIQVILALVLLFGIFAWLLAIGTTVLVYAGFELRRIHDQLVIQHGLLDRRRRTIPVRRIQALVTVEGTLRQPFGYGELKFESAGQAGRDAGESGVLYPFVKMTEMPELIRQACPEFSLPVRQSDLNRLPPRALRRYITPGAIGVLIVGVAINAIFWRWIDGPEWWTWAIFALLPPVILLGWTEYRTAGWIVTPVHLLMQWRTVTGRFTMVTRRQRLQHRSLTANPFQRRAGLATFHTAVASGSSGGHFSLSQLDRDDAERLLAQLAPPSRHSRPVTNVKD
ncbi:MAG: PH domain-containing protein [Thermomicrobiales bacterium]